MTTSRSRRLAVLALGIGIVAASASLPAAADNGTDTSALRDAVTIDGITDHLEAFQGIATSNGGNRAAGTGGHEASAEYVSALLSAAGYDVWTQPFTYDQFDLESQALEQVSPTPTAYAEIDDFYTMDYSGAGDVTAGVTVVDVALPPAGGSTSGCEADDFDGFPAGDIALLSRGTCTFREKVENAQAADAAAVVIFNEGNANDRLDTLFGTLDPPQALIPVVGTSFGLGEDLVAAAAGDLMLRVAVEADTRNVTTYNVLADSPTGRVDRTVVVGGHLDSVGEGPGINDNGSGTASILEVALQMSALGIEPTNRVRFAFWSGEEDGLIGSDFYVSQLTARELKQHALNLNFDMVASPNWAPFVYDGDGSAFGATGPNGSARIERVFLDYFASQGIVTEPTEFDGRSDYFGFINNGIPAGGLFTGAEGINPVNGIAYDPCYHQACDDIDNISSDALGVMSDAIAHVTQTFASTTSAVNGTAKGSGTGNIDMELKANRAFK